MIRSTAIIVGLLALPSIGAAQVPDKRAELTEDALRAAVRTADPAAKEQRISAARSKVEEANLRRPRDRMMATIVIRDGATIEFLSTLVRKHRVELARAEFKVAGDIGKPNTTISLGPEYLYAADGDLEERLAFAAEFGKEHLKLNEAGRESRNDPGRVPMDRRPMFIYAADLVGTGAAINKIAMEPRVVAVIPNERSTAVSDFDSYKQFFKSLPPEQRITKERTHGQQ